MIAGLKILHYLAFCIGIGGGLVGIFIGMRAATADAQIVPALRMVQRRIGEASFISVIVLWITGLWLLSALYGGGPIPPVFWVKLAVVIALTLCSVWLQVTGIRSRMLGTVPPMARMGMVSRIATGLAVLALVLAILAFG